MPACPAWASPLTENLTGGFDPGAVIDANGDGWLAYGTGESYIVKLGDDLHSIAAGPVKLNAPYYFEANELNYIGGKYVHTYNNDWSSHEPWTWGGEKPTACSMNYFTTTTPLEKDSWVYGANYFKNTGENGMNYGNNHTHLHKYQGKCSTSRTTLSRHLVPTAVSAASLSMRLRWTRRTSSSRSVPRPSPA